MTDKEKAVCAVNALKKEYPDAICSLVYTDPLQLLIATRLAAQCTDARVNIVTPRLFDTYKNVYEFAEADVSDVEEIIKSCGLYKTKAKDIVSMCRQIRDNFNGTVPDTIEKLTTLSGIGRKTANLIVGDIRITAKLGLHNSKDAVRIEKILRELLPPEESNDFCHRLVIHGRAVCTARNPKCDKCCMKSFCGFAEKNM